MILPTQIRAAFEWLGELSIFIFDTLRGASGFFRRIGIFLNQCEAIGVTSIPILSLAAVFVGAVMSYQLYTSFELFGAQGMTGGTMGVAMFRELAPVFGAIIVTGRSGASISAEIASMRISEQIDALEVMGVDPHEYLVVPRVVAGALMMPILAIYFGGVSVLSASFIACGVKGLPWPVFWTQLALWTDWIDMLHCGLKGFSFGAAITLLGSFYGFRSAGGARAVGYAARTTVVVSCITILLLDYFWTMVLPIRTYQLMVK